MREIDKDNLLRSWKEIAAYLGCEIRTCYRWEARHGMPVHRAEKGEKRSPVFAYKDELDRWFRETFRDSSQSWAKPREERSYLRWIAAGVAVLALAGAFLLFRGGRGGGGRQPAGFSIEGSTLVVLDKGGRELWRRDTGLEDLQTEDFYRRNFQVMHRDEATILPALVIRDIDGDGDREVLLAPKRVGGQTGEGYLHCFNRKGAELWKFRGGRELACEGQVFSPDYRIAGFHTHDLDGDGRLETVVESFQAPGWPCQLAVLDASGKMVGEFWNTGYLRGLAYHDLDGDGREELIVCGANEEYRGGCLIVFDAGRIGGSSPQTGQYACEGLGPGLELYYVTVPLTDVAEAEGLHVDGLRHVEITGNERIRVTAESGLYYEFGFDLERLQVSWGSDYIARHREMAKAGRIASVLDGAYREALLKCVRYWDGAAWVAGPAKNLR